MVGRGDCGEKRGDQEGGDVWQTLRTETGALELREENRLGGIQWTGRA